jgi:hypothetical protein
LELDDGLGGQFHQLEINHRRIQVKSWQMNHFRHFIENDTPLLTGWQMGFIGFIRPGSFARSFSLGHHLFQEFE